MRRTAQAAVVCGLVVLAFATGPAAARAQALPAGRWFEPPVADPLAPRFSVALMRTDLLAQPGPERPPFRLPDAADAADDVVAAVSLGGVLPVLRVSAWEGGGLSLFVDGRVFARFRIEYPERDDMGQDWSIAGGMDGRHRQWSGRLALTHRSSHLGDEFVERTGAQRIEYGSEQFDLILAREVAGAARVYAGGAWVFRSYIDWDERLIQLVEDDRASVQLGADGTWRPRQNPRFGIHAGVDWQAAERTEWRGALSAAIGAGIDSGEVAGRTLRFMLRYFDGPSNMGQFFLTTERYVSFEILATF